MAFIIWASFFNGKPFVNWLSSAAAFHVFFFRPPALGTRILIQLEKALPHFDVYKFRDQTIIRQKVET